MQYCRKFDYLICGQVQGKCTSLLQEESAQIQMKRAGEEILLPIIRVAMTDAKAHAWVH